MNQFLTPDFGYVILAGTASGEYADQGKKTVVEEVVAALGFMVFWKAIKVGQARKKYNIKYPKMYSNENDGDNVFNCVQVSNCFMGTSYEVPPSTFICPSYSVRTRTPWRGIRILCFCW